MELVRGFHRYILYRQNIEPLIDLNPIIRDKMMDNLLIIVDDWIRALKTMDPIRTQIEIERILENFHLFNIEDKRSIIFQFLNSIQSEHSEVFIKNYISCLEVLNKTSIVPSMDLLTQTINPIISKHILELTIQKIPTTSTQIDILIAHCISEPYSALFAYTISLITNNNLKRFIPKLKLFFLEQTSYLIKYYNGSLNVNKTKYEAILENIESLLISLNHFEVFEQVDKYKETLSNLCIDMIYSPLDPKNKKISKIISQLFYNIAVCSEDTNFLINQFQQISSELVKIGIIHKLSECHSLPNSGKILLLLREIAKDEYYYAFAVASMVKIGGEEVNHYILAELSSEKYRRVFFTTYFLPYLKFSKEVYINIIQDLLTYRQPLILKQALWVIRKKKLTNFVPQAIKLLFHENPFVRKEAQKVVLEAPYSVSIEYLTRNINYYGPDKQQVISYLIGKLRKLNP